MISQETRTLAPELEAIANSGPPAPAASKPGANTWAPVDLSALVRGENAEPPPSLLARTDGVNLLYAGKLHAISGEPEACKGWLALHATAEVLAAGQQALYIDFEDAPTTIVARLLALGTDPATIVAQLAYVRPDEPLTPAGQAALTAATKTAPALAVIDGMTEALAVHGLDLRDNSEVAKWLAMLPRPLARQGAAVVSIDHVVKDREGRGRYAIGAQHKLAGVDVAYALEIIEPFGRNREGKVKVTVTKDRHGHVREHVAGGRVATLLLTSRDGQVTARLEPPDQPGAGGGFRPTVLMERTSKALEESPGLSKRAVRETVRGKNDSVELALELLVTEGHVEVRREGQAHLHHVVRPYREDDDNPECAPVPQPCPDRAPARSEATVPPCPSLQGHGARGTVDPGTEHSVTVPEEMDW